MHAENECSFGYKIGGIICQDATIQLVVLVVGF